MLSPEYLHNTVYFWVGTYQRGTWQRGEVFLPASVRESEKNIFSAIRNLTEAGFYTVPGHTRLGPPTDRPNHYKFAQHESNQQNKLRNERRRNSQRPLASFFRRDRSAG